MFLNFTKWYFLKPVPLNEFIFKQSYNLELATLLKMIFWQVILEDFAKLSKFTYTLIIYKISEWPLKTLVNWPIIRADNRNPDHRNSVIYVGLRLGGFLDILLLYWSLSEGLEKELGGWVHALNAQPKILRLITLF